MEGPKLWFWEKRLKLLLMVSLLYSFLPIPYGPALPTPPANPAEILAPQNREAVPLPRLRTSLSYLWLAYPPQFSGCLQSSG